MSASSALPEGAVGLIELPKPSTYPGCTATVIQRKGRTGGAILLTAAHCMCGRPEGLSGSTSGIKFDRPVQGTLGTSISSTTKFFGKESDLCTKNRAADREVSDLAIVVLGNELPATLFPRVPRVYTSGDFLDRVTNAEGPPFPPFTRRLTGAAGFPQIIQGSMDRVNIDYLRPCSLLPQFDTCRPWVIRIDRDQGGPVGDPGDSGGPLTFNTDDGGSTIFGLYSGTENVLGIAEAVGFADLDEFSPTWENGNGNGPFIEQFLVDADEDGVDDRIDNAPPSLCPDDRYRCANPDQADGDGDGIGDVADNCPASVCTARGWPLAACANPDQGDFDGDGSGDACDSCPLVRNGDARKNDYAQFADADGDGVGDSCDNCDKKNPYRACTSPADCNGGACYGSPAFGKCSVTGESCLHTEDCPVLINPQTCTTGFGHCALQLDDADGDGLGGACDLCPNLRDARVSANSNFDAELRKSATPLGDLCDPVPDLVSRGIVGRVDIKSGNSLEPLGSTTGYTTFLTTAGLGVTDEGGRTTAASITDRAGFRYCDCVTLDGTPETRDACARNHCMPRDDSYMSGTDYFPVSTSVSTDISRLPGGIATLGQEVGRTFTNDVLCNDGFAHRGFSEPCRVGAQQQLTLWEHRTDVQAGRVRTYGTGKTAGLFMSHVVKSTGGTASTRDATILGLRDTLEYVTTPLVDFVQPVQTKVFSDCLLSGCMMIWRLDWVVDPPDVYRTAARPLDLTTFYGRIGVQGDGSIAVISRPRDLAFDVTASLDVGAATLIRNPSFGFLTPVEDGTAAHALPTRASAVAIANPWRQAARIAIGLGVEDGRLFAIVPRPRGTAPSRAAAASAPANPFGDVNFIPSDRDDSRAVFSGTEQAVYLVGGHRAGGRPTGEVWRFDLLSQTWDDLFMGKAPDVIPGDARAIAYDERSRRIVIVDDGVPGPPSKNGKTVPAGAEGPRFGRIVVVDVQARTIVEVAKFQRTDKYKRVSLVHRGDGIFLLVRAEAKSPRIRVSGFRLGADRSISWLGHGEARGVALDDPFRTSEGVLLPIRDGTEQDLVPLSIDERSHAAPPEDL